MRSCRWQALVAATVLGFGLLALANETSRGQAPAAKPGVVWEYKEQFGSPYQENEELLNSIGQEGWKLVAVGEDPGKLVRYTFKRPTQP